MAKVLIIGASRGIGLETVKAALLAGHNVRALARSAARIPIQNPGLDRVAGNALDSSTILSTLDGVDVVVQTLGVDVAPRSIFERTTLFSQSTRIIVDAMKAAGVKRLIAVTGLGAGNSRGHGGIIYDSVVFPLLLKRVYDDKDVQEWIIKSSGLDWTIVRPGLLTNRPATGHYRILTAAGDWRFGTISRADVAADFLDPWGNRIEIVSYENVQFTKAPNVLRGMGLTHLSKNKQAIQELTEKGMAPE
jgi:putative NADH-flavin reductase